MSNHQQEKARLRKEALAKRDALDPAQRCAFSLAAAKHAAHHIEFAPGTVLSGFYPIRSEIDPRPLMEDFRERGARLCLPVVMDKTTIVFREYSGDGELADTGFGTKGPGPDANVLDPEVLIMPLSVFDDCGGRIGYGAGHYDRAIERLINKNMQPRLFGYAFSCQQIDQVPVEAHDQPLEAVITEHGVITARQE